MAEFLVELYVGRTDAAAVESGAERARLGAAELTREGVPVSFMRSIFVPDDETCFFLFEAPSADVVRAAAQRAGLAFERVTEVLTPAGLAAHPSA
jgi:hypothetical protein